MGGVYLEPYNDAQELVSELPGRECAVSVIDVEGMRARARE